MYTKCFEWPVKESNHVCIFVDHNLVDEPFIIYTILNLYNIGVHDLNGKESPNWALVHFLSFNRSSTCSIKRNLSLPGWLQDWVTLLPSSIGVDPIVILPAYQKYLSVPIFCQETASFHLLVFIHISVFIMSPLIPCFKPLSKLRVICIPLLLVLFPFGTLILTMSSPIPQT